MLRFAKLQKIAIAACRVTLAGAAVTGAGRRQPFFDPIHQRLALGDTETGAAVTQTNPVNREAVRIRFPGRTEFNGVTETARVGC